MKRQDAMQLREGDKVTYQGHSGIVKEVLGDLAVDRRIKITYTSEYGFDSNIAIRLNDANGKELTSFLELA